MLERGREGARWRKRDRKRKPGVKTGRAGHREIAGRGSMKPSNPILRGKDIKLKHNVTTNQGNEQLAREQNTP